MDKLETYIKMADCEEVQGRWEPMTGDMVFYNDGAGIVNTFILDSCTLSDGNEIEGLCQLNRELHQEVMGGTKQYQKEGKFPLLVGAYLWLPYQHQIQEMMGVEGLNMQWVSFLRFYVSHGWIVHEYAERFNTQEQLWLAFYMYEKHSKTWDGEKWGKK